MPRLTISNSMGVSTGRHFGVLLGTEGDWHRKAHCRYAGTEMVPGDQTNHASEGDGVQAAKEVCIGCPVREQCLAHGKSYPGIYGGLTLDERERIRVSRHVRTGKRTQVREVVECEVCLLDCVPRMRNIRKCDTCLPEEDRPQSPEAHKQQIIELIEECLTYKEIAAHEKLAKFGLKAEAIGKACRRWGSPSKVTIKRPSTASDAQVVALPVRTPGLLPKAA